MYYRVQNGSRSKKGVFKTGKGLNMTRLPEKLRKSLNTEALEWEEKSRWETEESVSKDMERAEVFNIPRPPRQPVSVRMDIRDISLLKRLSRRRGITYSQLIVQWLHERLDAEYRAEH